MSRPLAVRVRSLYRGVLRAQRRFSAPDERAFIGAQLAAIRDARTLADPAEIRRRLEAGERQLGVANHYGIAFPRTEHHVDAALTKDTPLADEDANTPAPPRISERSSAREFD